MNIAFCFESVMPTRGGCETYIADLARRLCADRHQVHLYASKWDAQALPKEMVYHALSQLGGPRFLRPWRFGLHCLKALKKNQHDVSLGFDKTWGQDILYPQGGLHLACADHNLLRFRAPWMRVLARAIKKFDPAGWSFRLLERRQYLGAKRPLIVVNSQMVRGHFRHYYGIPAEELFVVRSAIDPNRFGEHDRPKQRLAMREQWKIPADCVVGLFAAMNYQLKGLVPLLHALKRLLARPEFVKNQAANGARSPVIHLVIAGHASTGPYERLARWLKVDKHVSFIGHRDDMRCAYFAADFMVHPTFYDPCSLVVLEALACGLPVITTRYNGAAELLSPPREGYVVDNPHDRDQLAWCMLQMLDANRRQACAQAARQAALQWTFELHYRQLLGVFAACMARKDVPLMETA